jgi:hypothetical protein
MMTKIMINEVVDEVTRTKTEFLAVWRNDLVKMDAPFKRQ